MILPDFKAFPRQGRIMGLDWGARRTGVAVSDPSREFIFVRSPVLTPRGGPDWAHQVAAQIAQEGVCAVVIGRPVHADGTPSDTTDDVMRAATALAGVTDVPIAFIDENLTSFAAQESMGRVRVRDIKARLDSEAARVILENAIALINRMQS